MQFVKMPCMSPETEHCSHSHPPLFGIYLFSTSLSLAGNLGCLSWVRHSSLKSSATHFLSVCAAFLHFQTLAVRRWGMWLHMGAVQAPYESLHWKLTLGENSLAIPGTQTHICIASGFLVRHSTNWAIPVLSPVPHLYMCKCLMLILFEKMAGDCIACICWSKLMAVSVAPLLFIRAIIFLSFILQCT